MKRALFLGLALLLAACGPVTAPEPTTGLAALRPVALAAGERLRVVVTTNIAADVVARVGGDRIQMTTLIPVGVDPHSYSPTPRETAALYDAHVLFANGAGLEMFLEKMIATAGGSAQRVNLATGLSLLTLPPAAAGGTEGGPSSSPLLPSAATGGTEGGPDPHVWFDVRNVIHWVETIRQALAALDPGGAAAYRANAEAYTRELEALDAWVAAQTAGVPEAHRKLVIDHPVLGYFAARYGFEQLGAVYPVSPSAEPSAQDLAALETAIRQLGVPAVFSENTVNPKLADQVARDTGIRVVLLYTDSLGLPGSPATTYERLMRYDVGAIVDALQ